MNERITASSGEDDSSHRRGATSRERGTEEIGSAGITNAQAPDNEQIALAGDLGGRKAAELEPSRAAIPTHAYVIERSAAVADAHGGLEVRSMVKTVARSSGNEAIVGEERTTEKRRERGEHEDAEAMRARAHEGESYRSGWRKRPFRM